MADAVATMLDAIALDPADDAAWLALADALEDAGRPREAEVARLRERLRHMGRDDPERPDDERRIQKLLADGVTPVGPSRTLFLPRDVPMEFRLIPPGAFWMGSPPDEPGRSADEPLRRVAVERGFWLATTLTTNEQSTRQEPATYPVRRSWGALRDAVLSHRWGRHVRLPTEAEWEYACRAGTTSACHGGDLFALPLVGWASYGTDPGRQRTKPVAQFAPNAWGLFDMHGNLWEWTGDEPSTGLRIIKGGCHRALPTFCRSASRTTHSTAAASQVVGVRYLIDLD